LIQTFSKDHFIPKQEQLNEIADFLYTHLEEYGDAKEAIHKCIQYVKDRGGFIFTVRTPENELAGVSIINETGMAGYIPENILVYIAVDKKQRGFGYGKKLIAEIMDTVKGDIALHVDFQNAPAIGLYEKLGFKKKYYEMRLLRS
jgi:ribosomal protein S18 acetylase RimI-like enzyme